MNLEFNSTCRRKKHSLFHWNALMLNRSTHTDLDVEEEKRIDDYWNVDSSKHLSDSWRGFHKVHSTERETSKGYMWSGTRLAKIQTTTRPDYVWPEVWTKIGKAALNRDKQEWQKRNRSLTMLESWEGFTQSIRMTKNVQKWSKKTQGENAKTCCSCHALQARQTAFQHRENECWAEK